MTTRSRATRFVLGALTALILVVVDGCATAAVPADPVEQPSERPPTVYSSTPRATLHAVGKTDSDSGDNDFVDGANSSDADEEPTFTDAELSDQVERATRGFMTASLTRGYPAKDNKAQLRRAKRLMTLGAARQQSLDGEQASADLYKRRERTRAEVDSVDPTVVGAGQARAKVMYRLITERKQGGSWRTVKTGQPQEKILELVQRSGEGWLVSSTG